MRAWEFLPRPIATERVGAPSTGTAYARAPYRCFYDGAEHRPGNMAHAATLFAERAEPPEHRHGRR